MDTWRQSRQQVVFIIMLIVLAVIAITAVIVPKKIVDENGEDRLAMTWSDEPAEFLEEQWTAVYAQTLLLDDSERINPFDEESAVRMADKMNAMMEAAEAEADTPKLNRGVEFLLMTIASGIFTISMILFLAACAGYYPAMLEAGAVDIVLAKPIDRLRVFLGKYVGGLALYSAAIAVTYLIVFVGVGIRTGVWHGGIFFVMPMQIFAAGVLYAILAALGVVSRSSTLCLVVGLAFYIVIDMIVGALVTFQQMGAFAEWPLIENVAVAMRWGLPNFGILKANAAASVLNIPLMEWQPFLVAAVWLLGALAFGYWRFRRTDY
jgi:ABC-type transport system involved in multi-copper enzyme maturation permease subunit